MADKTPNMIKRCKVLIIGAGAAGLAAADRLDKAEVKDFLVIEAEDRVGGRVCSGTVREGGSMVEYGAQWIHGEKGNVVHDIASQFGMLSEKGSGVINDVDAMFLYEDGRQLSKDMAEEMMMIFSSIEESLEKDSKDYTNQGQYYHAALQAQLQERGLHSNKEMCAVAGSYLQWYGRLQASIDGAPTWYQTAVDQNLQYRECEGDQTVTLANGNTFQGLLQKIGENVMDRVHLGEKVKKLLHSQNLDCVKVETNKSVYEADYVIVTLSLGVLKDQVDLFDPPLPEERMSLINNMGFGTIAKIFVEFPVKINEVLPEIKPAGFNFLNSSDLMDTVLQNTANTPWVEELFGLYPDQADPHLLVAWLTGPAAHQVESLTPPQVLEKISAVIAARLAPSLPSLPPPVSTTVTGWGGNPLTRGSYSYITPTTPPGTPENLSQPLGRICWAGEATHPSYFSTVHGAVETGWREADRIRHLLFKE